MPLKNPRKKIIRIKVSPITTIFKHAFVGLIYGCVNEFGSYIMPNNKQIYEIETDNIPIKLEGLPETMIEYDKKQLINNLESDFHLITKKKNHDFLKNFLYGSLIVFISTHSIKKIQLILAPNKKNMILRFILALPLSILPYYGFCAFFDNKELNEFTEKFKEDFIPLGISKCFCDFAHNTYVSKIKSISGLTAKGMTDSRIFRYSWIMIFSNMLWIFLLTSFYHDRLKIYLPNPIN